MAMGILKDMATQGELAEKDKELAASSIEIEKLLQKISENTAVAEKEKVKVAVIVSQVTTKAQVHTFNTIMSFAFFTISEVPLHCIWLGE